MRNSHRHDHQWVSGLAPGWQVCPLCHLMLPPEKKAALPEVTKKPEPFADVFGPMIRESRGAVLLQWGKEHGYPRLSFSLPSGRTHTLVSGSAAWFATCQQCALDVIEAALACAATYQEEVCPPIPEAGREQRLALIKLGRARQWARCVWEVADGTSLVLDGGERDWMRYASSGKEEHIRQAVVLLEQETRHRWEQRQEAHLARMPGVVCIEAASSPRGTVAQIRERFLAAGERANYPNVLFRTKGEQVCYKLPDGGAAGYQQQAAVAKVPWLKGAILALEHIIAERQQAESTPVEVQA